MVRRAARAAHARRACFRRRPGDRLGSTAGASPPRIPRRPRAYLNVLGRFAGGVTARLTVDVQRFGTIATTPPTTDNSLRLRLKYGFATYTPQGSPVTFKAGLIHTPWLDWEEAVWDYRMQGTMATDRAGYLSAADYGVGVEGKWMADKVNFQ